jgi:hypothetical protein
VQAIFQFLKNGIWHDSLSKQKIQVLAKLAPKVFFDKISSLGSPISQNRFVAARTIQK